MYLSFVLCSRVYTCARGVLIHILAAKLQKIFRTTKFFYKKAQIIYILQQKKPFLEETAFFLN